MEKITLMKKEDVINKFLWDVQLELLTPDKKNKKNHEIFKKVILEIIQNGKSEIINKAIEYPIITKKNNIKWIENDLFFDKYKRRISHC